MTCQKILCLFVALSLLFCVLSACGEQTAASPAALGEAAPALSPAPESEAVSASSSSPEISGPEEKAEESAAPQEEADPDLISARVLAESAVYAAPSPGEPLALLKAGAEVWVDKTADPLWYLVTLEDGTEGYLYGELLAAVKEDGTTGDTLFKERFLYDLDILRRMLPEGKYWNHMGLELPWKKETPFLCTDIPCDHSRYGEEYCNFYIGSATEFFNAEYLNQCLGFAALLSDHFFMESAPYHAYQDLSQLRIGDHIRMKEYEHSMTVVDMTEEYIVVGEVNQDYEHCLISWSRKISYEEARSYSWDYRYITRYPFRKNPDGSLSPWE